ncbi:MAG: endonuclease Q family protein [Chloroflexi bacterium]|nr:endonuclease Q family protein [Chloroflexota bacterium]
MRVICDLHLHSRYSLATSKSLDLRSLADGAKQVGIDLLAAPDFTHPHWREEMRSELVETQYGSGVFTTRGRNFVLMSEVSCIWRQDGQSRRVHILIAAPSFEAVDKMSTKFAKLQNLESDGRPIFKISARELFEIVRDADPRCELIPAHVFTPWYGVFGAKSGFDSLGECFGDYADEIPAVETGLSSDPSMHWSVPDSRARAIVSFSDAHSVASLGREATVLEIRELSYESVISALRGRDVVETYEFHPEHGKYHLDGHRKCGVRMHPDASDELGGVCPNCLRGMTLGVLNRTRAISDGPRVGAVKDATGQWEDPLDVHPPYRHLVPLNEILAYTLDVGKSTKRVMSVYSELTDAFGNEFSVLLSPPESEITTVTKRDDVARAIINARFGNVELDAGYDGVFGSAIPRVIE